MKRFYLKLCVLVLMIVLFINEGRQVMVTARKVDELELVSTLGIDRGKQDPNAVLVTAIGGSQGSTPPLFLKEEDLTVSQAVVKMRTSVDKNVFFGHVEQLLIGEDAALEHMGKQLDFTARDLSMRLDAALYVVKGATAAWIMKETENKGNIIFDYLRTAERDAGFFPTSYPFELREVLQQLLMTDGCALVPALMLDEEQDKSESQELTPNTELQMTAKEDGQDATQDQANEANESDRMRANEGRNHQNGQSGADSQMAQEDKDGGDSELSRDGQSSKDSKEESEGNKQDSKASGESDSTQQSEEEKSQDGGSGGKKSGKSSDAQQESEGNITTSNAHVAILDGYAVFKDYKLVDYIGPEEARGVNLFFQKMHTDSLVMTGPNGGYISLKVARGTAKVTPEFEGDVLRRLRVDLEFLGDINEMRGEKNKINQEFLDDMQKQLCERETCFVLKTIQRSQELEADFLNLGNWVECKAPIKWQKIKDQWGEIFPKLEIVINTDAQINRTYDIIEPIS